MTIGKIRLGSSIIHNPILVSYAAKGILPYRGLDSGVKRAVEEWPEIDFLDDHDGCLFTVTVHRKSGKMSGKKIEKVGEPPKTSGKILAALIEDGNLTVPELAVSIGVTERSIERNIKNLQE